MNSTDPSGSRPIWEQNEGGNNGYTDSGTCEYEIATGPYARAANCYAYAFHMEVDPRTGDYFDSKPQPGDFSGTEDQFYQDKSLGLPPELIRRRILGAVKRDGRVLGYSIKQVASADYQTSEGQWLVALAFSLNKDNYIKSDYHWYRRDENGTWSHKPGATSICYADGSGNPIFDPARCNRQVNNTNYSQFWGYFIISKGEG